MKIRIECGIMMALYFSLNCIALSFATYYLSGLGFSNRTIGIIFAVACLAGGAGQGIMGWVSDRIPALYWKNLLLFYTLIVLMLFSALLFVTEMYGAGVLFALIMLIVLLMLPMVNTAGFYYSAHGVSVNFGVIRGIGATAFAAMSYVAGALTNHFDMIAVPALGILSSILLFGIVLIMPKCSATDAIEEKPKEQQNKDFLRQYPVFVLAAFGIGLVLVLHNMLNTYLLRIIEAVGGKSHEMGIALAIAAIAELPMLYFYSFIAKKTHIPSGVFIVIAGSFFVLRGILYLCATSVTKVYAIQLLQSVSFGLLAVVKANYANECVAKEYRTTGQSVMTMTDSFGVVAGSLVGGYLVQAGGISLMLLCGAGIAFVGTLVTLSAFLLGKKSFPL